MGFWDHDDSQDRQAYDQVQNADPNEAHFSHELIAGAASFYAMKKYQDHQEQNGKPQSWDTAKEIIAGFAGAEAVRLAETKGADEVDQYRAKHDAEERAKQALGNSGQFGQQDYQRQEYGGQGGYGQRDGGFGGDQGGYGGNQGGYGGQQGGFNDGGYGGQQGGGNW